MHLLDLTLPTPAENVALDQALLDEREADDTLGPVLRIWEPDGYSVVVGRSSDAHVEVNVAACRASGVPIMRRASGGGTVLAGPGCLMYAVVLPYTDDCPPRDIGAAHQYVLGRIAASLAPLVPTVVHAGTSDLAFDRAGTLWKFSGNSLRMKRGHFLYHGTLLYDFELERVSQLLAQQTREPAYRAGRAHREFIANVPVARDQLVAALVSAWQADEPLPQWPRQRTATLAATIEHV